MSCPALSVVRQSLVLSTQFDMCSLAHHWRRRILILLQMEDLSECKLPRRRHRCIDEFCHPASMLTAANKQTNTHTHTHTHNCDYISPDRCSDVTSQGARDWGTCPLTTLQVYGYVYKLPNHCACTTPRYIYHPWKGGELGSIFHYYWLAWGYLGFILSLFMFLIKIYISKWKVKNNWTYKDLSILFVIIKGYHEPPKKTLQHQNYPRQCPSSTKILMAKLDRCSNSICKVSVTIKVDSM